MHSWLSKWRTLEVTTEHTEIAKKIEMFIVYGNVSKTFTIMSREDIGTGGRGGRKLSQKWKKPVLEKGNISILCKEFY